MGHSKGTWDIFFRTVICWFDIFISSVNIQQTRDIFQDFEPVEKLDLKFLKQAMQFEMYGWNWNIGTSGSLLKTRLKESLDFN